MNKTKMIALGFVINGIIVQYTLNNEYDYISGLLIGCGVGLKLNRWKSEITT